MKTFTALILAMAMSMTLADEPKSTPNCSSWLKLSVRLQNIAWTFQTLDPSGQPDPSYFTDDLKEIDKLLAALVSEDAVIKAAVKLRAPKGHDEDFEKVFEFAQKLGESYGQYTALELMDLGLRRRLSSLDIDKPLVLNVHLPAEQLKAFQAFVKEHDLAEK